jgi:ubiquinone/menaquinone biosynthesis C-methylase UbiE
MSANDAIGFHSEQATAWEAGYSNPTFAVRFDILATLLHDRNLSGQVWLDAGCGTGTLARWLASRKACRVLGVDASAQMIANCDQTPGTEFRVISDISKMDLTDGAFDGVLCSSVLEYTRSPEAALRELRRVIRKGGLLLVSVPSSSLLARLPTLIVYWLTKPLGRWRQLSFLDHSKVAYSPHSFSRLLRLCRFEPQDFRKFGEVRFGGFKISFDGTMIMFLAVAE